MIGGWWITVGFMVDHGWLGGGSWLGVGGSWLGLLWIMVGLGGSWFGVGGSRLGLWWIMVAVVGGLVKH